MRRKKITWKCYVTNITDTDFEAVMYEIRKNTDSTYEIGKFSLEKLSTDQLVNLTIGSIFTYEINFETESDKITLYPNKPFSKKQKEKANKRAEELFLKLKFI